MNVAVLVVAVVALLSAPIMSSYGPVEADSQTALGENDAAPADPEGDAAAIGGDVRTPQPPG